MMKTCQLMKDAVSAKERKTSGEPMDVTQTDGCREAMEDIEKGRITKYDSLKDFFAEMSVLQTLKLNHSF